MLLFAFNSINGSLGDAPLTANAEYNKGGVIVHKVIQSYLASFSDQHGLLGMSEADQFERFVNYCVVREVCPDDFDPNDVTTATDDDGIDGVAVLIDDELVLTAEDANAVFEHVRPRRTVDVRYVLCQAKRTPSFDLGEMGKFSGGVLKLFGGPDVPKNELLLEFLAIHNIVIQNLAKIHGGQPTLEMKYVTTGVWEESNGLAERELQPKRKMLARLDLFRAVTYEVVDRARLISLWNLTFAPVDALFPVKGYVAFPPIKDVSQSYLAVVPAKKFVENVLRDADGKLRSSVFEQNVRSFLGEENPVNAGMLSALKDLELHDRFAINNNGITVVASSVKVANDRISVTDYQIVNGCQSSHVLHRSYESLTHEVWIPVKIIEAVDETVVAHLVESTNSQSQVDETQFLSIRPFTRKLEAYFNAYEVAQDDRDRRLFFERRTNQYAGSSIGRPRIFDIPKIARVFASMFLGMPHLAYMYPTQVFKARRKDIFCEGHREHPYYIAALALYRLEMAFSNQYLDREFQGYKWHILMVVRMLYGKMEDMPRLESPKIEDYCGTIEKALKTGGKAALPPFEDAIRIIKRVGLTSRDRRKGQPYTDELKAAALKERRRKEKAKAVKAA